MGCWGQCVKPQIGLAARVLGGDLFTKHRA